MSKRKQHAPEPKAKVALEALKGEETTTDLASRFGVHPRMVHQWKRALLEGASDMFECSGRKKPEIDEEQMKELHAKIGGLAVANPFLESSRKKAEALGREVRRGMVEPDHPELSITQQCRRSRSRARPSITPVQSLALLRLIDGQFLETPFLRCPAADLAFAQ